MKKFPAIERRFTGEDKENFYQDFYGQDADARQCAALTKIGMELAEALYTSVIETDRLLDNGFTFCCKDAAFVMTIIMREVAMIANLTQKDKEYLLEDIQAILAKAFGIENV